jgi:hypothetical protein
MKLEGAAPQYELGCVRDENSPHPEVPAQRASKGEGGMKRRSELITPQTAVDRDDGAGDVAGLGRG